MKSVSAHAAVQSPLLGALLENAAVGALAVDEGHYVAANERACELTGYAREELIGRRVGELNPFSALPEQFVDVSRGVRNGGVVTICRKDGEEIRVCYRAVDSKLAGMRIILGLFWPA